MTEAQVKTAAQAPGTCPTCGSRATSEQGSRVGWWSVVSTGYACGAVYESGTDGDRFTAPCPAIMLDAEASR